MEQNAVPGPGASTFLKSICKKKKSFLVHARIKFLWVTFAITVLALRAWTRAWDPALVSMPGFRDDCKGFCVNILRCQSGLGVLLPKPGIKCLFSVMP